MKPVKNMSSLMQVKPMRLYCTGLEMYFKKDYARVISFLIRQMGLWCEVEENFGIVTGDYSLLRPIDKKVSGEWT